MPATAPEPVCIDPSAWDRAERERAEWDERHVAARDLERRMLAAMSVVSELSQEYDERFPPSVWDDLPYVAEDSWKCSGCDKTHPSPALILRHIEFGMCEGGAC